VGAILAILYTLFILKDSRWKMDSLIILFKAIMTYYDYTTQRFKTRRASG
jgi:hypothetical protein